MVTVHWHLRCFGIWPCLVLQHWCHSHAGKHANGSRSPFWAVRLLFEQLWDPLVTCLWVPYHCIKLGILAGMLLFSLVLFYLPLFCVVCGMMMMLSSIPVPYWIVSDMLWPTEPSRQPQSPTSTGRQEQMTPNQQPQSPNISGTQLHQQMGSSRQSQA